MCISLMNTTACSDGIQINTVAASTVNTEIRVYPAEGPMPRVSEAPFDSALLEVVDHSRCRTMFAVQSHERITSMKTP